MTKLLFCIAGEASGDLHCSNLIKALRELSDEPIHFMGIGGDRMATQQCQLIAHIRDTQYMGFVTVAKNLHRILKLFQKTKRAILQAKPHAIILVDYPGFNLRIAKWASQKGFKVFYYISPQVWAWKKSRVNIIKKYVDHLFCILPFEPEFYARYGVDVTFVGHPLLDVIEPNERRIFEVRSERDFRQKPTLVLLPGSRKEEIKHMLPVMLRVAERFPDLNVSIAAAPSIQKEYYESFFIKKKFPIFQHQTYQLLRLADYALVTSGTATLEAALFRVPQIICYKGDWISYWIARLLVKIPFIGLPNLIMGRQIVPELIQGDFNEDNVTKHLNAYLTNEELRKQTQAAYRELYEKLGGKGASYRVAKELLKRL